MKGLKNWIDDICYMAGTVCISAGGFLLHAAAGCFILGGALIAYSILIARR